MPTSANTIAELPRALEHREEIRAGLAGREPAMFLDYDGTLTPIVEDPAEATLPAATRQAVARLAAACPTAVVSGRDLDDVRAMVDLEGLHYAGSHGFDILTADGESIQEAREHLPALDEVEEALRGMLGDLDGVGVERKRFAVAVHYRRAEEAAGEVEDAVDEVVGRHDGVRKTGGKRIFEVRPDVEWDKGRALRFLLERLGLTGARTVPVYVGDDVTDEDAFRALGPGGLGLVVRGETDERATGAHYALEGPDEVRVFLEELTAMVEMGL